MFSGSRRHRPPVTSQTSAPANPNAATAASAAFMAASNPNPNRALSSAAAAAALRARPHTPIDVGAVETKRTQRRSASVSSHGSGRFAPAQASQRQGRGLERQPSSGSMTERTFRTPSPSPHRAAALAPIAPEPPVPQIPANHRTTQSAAAHGVGMQTFRTASQKMAAKPTSYYTQPQGDTGNVRTSDAGMRPRSSVIQDQHEPHARSESRASSINYSYPSGYRPQSPPASPTFHRNSFHDAPAAHVPISPPRSSRTSAASSAGSRAEPVLVYDPNSRRMVPAPQPAQSQYNTRQEANKQSKKKKKKDQGIGFSGSHLARGTMGRAKGTAVDDYQPETQQPAPVTESRKSAQEAEPVHQEFYRTELEERHTSSRNQQPRQTHFQELGLADAEAPIEPPMLSAPERLSSPPPIRSVVKKPSMVREEPEDEEEDVPEVITPLSQKVLQAVEASPSQATATEAHLPPAADLESEDDLESDAEPLTHAITTADIPRPSENFANERPGSFVENKQVREVAKTASRRNDSISPDRRARFGPSVAEQLTVRHHPPGRSASPIKSAMKRSGGSSRDVSPSEHGSESQAAAAMVSDPVAARKKAVRVSFDERSNVIMGETGDSPTSSPQSKRPWYSSLGRKKRDVALEDDEVMKPRPALPSFGSVRDKKARGDAAAPEERPLIRPSDALRPTNESIYSAVRAQSPEVPHYRTAEEQAQLESSSDYAIGTVLSQDHESRNEANTPRFREPLPPVVTSVEGNGYHMDTTTDESDADLLDQSMTLDDEDSPVTSTHTTQPSQDDHSMNVEEKVLLPTNTAARRVELPAETAQQVPEIAVILPSPMANEETPKAPESQSRHYFEVPGGFPTDSSDSAKDTAQNTPAEAIIEREPAVRPAQTPTLPQTVIVTTDLIAQPTRNDTSGSDSESIYSDAYEDLSDIEGGFASIDAIVESPVTNNASPPSSQAQSPTIQSNVASLPQPTAVDEEERIVKDLPTKAAASPTATGQDWSQAEAFWRSLTAEKRQQLAKEYMEDEGVDGDREEISTPVRRNSSRRKSAEKKQILAAAEKQAQPAATKAATKASNVDPERTYMIQPGSKTKHNVPSAQENVHMRKSLRGNQTKQAPTTGVSAAARGSLRKSMRETPEPQAQTPAPILATRTLRERPTTSSGVPSSQTNGAKHSATGLVDSKAASAALAKQMMPKMTRRGSDASDSSFQRSRRPASSAGFGFRSSMRGPPPARNQATSPTPREQASKGSGRWSLRSLSPPAALRRDSLNLSSSPAQAGMMRQSLRGNKSQESVAKRNSLHLPFSKSSKTTSVKKQKRSSRFAGSSDEEDDVRPPGFSSRFNDSSDEEDERPGSSSQGSALSRGSLRSKPAKSTSTSRKPTTPVLEEPESPELPDSDNEDPFQGAQRPAPVRPTLAAGQFSRTNSGNIGTNSLHRSGSGRGKFVTTISADTAASPPRRERRGSFMGSILRRNKKADQAGKIQRSELTESAARRDTRLERDADALRELRGAEERPTSPRQQKKHFFGRKREDSWPLPEEEEEATAGAGDKAAEAGAPGSPIFQRPSSSNGKLTKNITGLSQRPNFAGRRSTSLGLTGIPETNGHVNGVSHYSQRAFDQDSVAAMSEPGVPKKKKFGSLRKMFGLAG